MKKCQFLLFFLIILQSCQSNLLVDNKPIIDKIDKLNFSKTTYEVSIDANENSIDTLTIEKIKTDKKGNVLYKLKEFSDKYRPTKKQTYYRSNKDLFYSVTDFENLEWKTVYETFVNKDNEIAKAQMITIEPTSSDTIVMKYNYTYNSKGKKETLSIVSIFDSINSVNFTKFNDTEKSEFNYQLIGNDTIQINKTKYLNGNRIASTQERKEPYKMDVYSYDANENVTSKKTFVKRNDTILKFEEYIYKNNNLGNLEKIIIKDFINDTIMKRKIITTYNNQ